MKSLIEASTLLHFRQRTVRDGCYVATQDDYELVYGLVGPSIRAMLTKTAPISDAALKWHSSLLDFPMRYRFTRKEAIAYTDSADSTAKKHRRELVAARLVIH